MRHYLLTLLLMMAAMTAMGQQTVSVADARAKATAFLNRNAGAKGGTVTTDVQLAYTAQQGAETYYYVFNNGSDGKGGFVIIGGDETARTILGYSDNGTFDYATAPENLKWWLSQYEQQISAAIKNGGTTAAAKGSMGLTAIAKADIEPLVKTTWDQVAPYNTAIPWVFAGTPDYTTVNAIATGCVATAAAQIMKYYKYPEQGTGSSACTTSVNGVTFSADFESTTYEWSKMADTYDYNTYSGTTSGTGTDAENAVATLMYHCGVAANMTYGTLGDKGSSAYNTNMGKGLVTYFGYDKSMTREAREDYTDDEWAQIIYDELNAGRPVLYGGQTSGGSGHAFVCSGYKNDGGDLFHINWGWNGNHNGYFPLQGTVNGVTALKPDGTGSGGAAAGSAYDQSQDIIIGIKPDAGGAPKVTCNSLSLTSNCISPGNGLGISSSFTNNSFLTLNFTYGIKLVNNSTSAETYLEYSTYSNVSWGQGFNFSRSVSTSASMAAGTYTVYPYYKDGEGVWHPMSYSIELPTLTVLADGEGMYVTGTPAVSDEGYVTTNSGTITVRIWNKSDATLNTQLVGWVYRLINSTYTPVGYITATASFAAQETKDVVFNISDYSNAGMSGGQPEHLSVGNAYYLGPSWSSGTLYNSSGNNYNELTEFQCTTKLDIAYKLSSLGWGTICLPYSAEKPEGMTLYNVTGNSGGTLITTEATEIEMNTPYLVSGTAGTYDFSGPTTPTGTHTNGLLTGNTASEDISVPEGSFVMQNLTSKLGLAFYKVVGNTQKCSPYKAYLTLPSGLSGLFSALLFTDGTTGIESIEATGSQQSVRKVIKDGRLTIETPQGIFSATGARMK